MEVKSRRRLVQKHDRGTSHQGSSDVETSAHAAGVGPDGPVGRIRQVEALEQVVGAGIRKAGVELGEAPGHAEVLAAGQVRVDRRVLAGQPNPAANAVGVFDHVPSQHLGPAAVRGQDRREDAHRGGLPGPVGAQEAQHAPGGRLEVHAVERDQLSEAFDQALGQDGGTHEEQGRI